MYTETQAIQSLRKLRCRDTGEKHISGAYVLPSEAVEPTSGSRDILDRSSQDEGDEEHLMGTRSSLEVSSVMQGKKVDDTDSDNTSPATPPTSSSSSSEGNFPNVRGEPTFEADDAVASWCCGFVISEDYIRSDDHHFNRGRKGRE